MAEVCDAADGDELRPFGELREAPPASARGVKPVPESESSWGRDVSTSNQSVWFCGVISSQVRG